MGITFTETQRQVIEQRGCNLLVSAAAGSGKTAVLVERIVKMVCEGENPVDIDRLLVVTFTNAAAAQMREKVGRALSERISLDPANEHLQRQMTLLYNAQITTIDSFCLFILRNQFHTIGLDPGFRIAEEGEVRLLRGDVLAGVMEEAYEKEDPAFLHCMEYFSPGSRDEAVEKEVMKLYDFAMSMPFPERWLARRKQDYLPGTEEKEEEGAQAEEEKGAQAETGEDASAETACEILRLPWAAVFLEHVRLMLSGCVEKLSAAVKLCEEPDGPYFYAPLLEKEREMAEELLRACGGAADGGSCADSGGAAYALSYDAICGAFGAAAFDRLPSKRDSAVSPARREAAKGLRDSVKETLTKLRTLFFNGSSEQVCRQMGRCQAAVSALVDLTLAFKEAFDAAKRERNILDFDDIEHFALQVLLREEEGNYVPTETALAYRSRFHEILIDEYQDSNLVQEYLLSCISGEAEGRFNRFMVGDVKQSIYKFRLARPELFLEKHEAYGQAGENAMRIDLHQNFRSRVEVLNSVNAVFSRIMGKEAGGIVYDERAALHPGAAYPGREAGLPSDVLNGTELLLFQEQKDLAGVSPKEQEAYGVAARIKKLLRDFQVTDRETGKMRRAACRDIVILLRTLSGWDEVFKRVLEEEGIPVHVTSRTGYFAAPEVQELLHFLRILDNPLQDIPLYGVLHAYLGGFSEEEIALVRAACPKNKYLYDALKACSGENAQTEEAGQVEVSGQTETTAGAEAEGQADCTVRLIDARLREKISDFLGRITRYRELAVYLSVHELLQTILRETGYLYHVAARPEGSRRRANVDMLLVKAADFEKTSYFGLYHFLRYMEQLEKYEVDYGEAAVQDENADVVRIMSIHKSKGLEFPICFVSGLAQSFGKKESGGTLVADVDAGVGVDYVDPEGRVKSKNLRKNTIAVKLKRDSLAEELRILYVAMTRAEEKLIMTGMVKDLQKTAAALLPLRRRRQKLLTYDVLMEQDSFMTLLLSALAGNRCLDELYEACGMDTDAGSPEYAEDMGFCVKLTGWDYTVEKKIEETISGMEAKRKLFSDEVKRLTDANLMTKLSDRFAYEYPHQNLKNLYTKTTVSELKMAGMHEKDEASARLFEEKPVAPYLPKFLKGDERVSGSMRGSAFHKVMELIDFTKLTKEVNADAASAEAYLREQMEKMLRSGRLSQEYYEAVSVPKLVAFLTGRAALRMAEAARAGKLYKEQPFVMGLPASRLGDAFPSEEMVLIQGIIDVFFEEEDGFVVLDYKTDAVSTPEELVKRYQVQLDYYSEALEQISGYPLEKGAKPVKERILYSFKLGREITVIPEKAGRTSVLL